VTGIGFEGDTVGLRVENIAATFGEIGLGFTLGDEKFKIEEAIFGI